MASSNPFSILDDASLSPEEKISQLSRQSFDQALQLAQKDTEVDKKNGEAKAAVAERDAEVAWRELVTARLVSTSNLLFKTRRYKLKHT